MEIPSSNTARPTGIPAVWNDKAGNAYSFKAAWFYRSPDGEPQGIVCRFESDHHGKQVIPFFKPDGGKFKAGGPQASVLFGAERLNGQRPLPLALVVEGEKAAAALHSLGLLAVSAQGGANNAGAGAWDALLGVQKAVFWPDNDEPGIKYCRDAAAALAALEAPDSPLPELRLLRVPKAPDKGDVCDWIAERLPGWNELDPVPSERRDALRAEVLALLDTAEPVPADWLKPPVAQPDRAERGGPFGNRYVEQDGGITWLFEKNGEFQEQRLCNFTARIALEVQQDNGLETNLLFRLTGCHDGRELPAIDLTYETFVGMAWPTKQWHSGCLVEPGTGIKDALRAAIQTLSNRERAVERRVVFTHTGWRAVSGEWVYLHGGGAIGAGGPVAGIETDLGDLARYALPDPSKTAQERQQAAQASAGYLTLADLSITLPLLSCAFLAPLAQALRIDFMIWLEAPSQSQKSSLAGVLLAHFGPTLDRTCLTANWTATANSLEGTLFTLADCLSVIDDYAPQSSSAGQAKLDAIADRLVRGAGNLQGRARLNKDLSRSPAKYPRGLCLATAEQSLTGESLNARLFGVSMRRGDVNLAQLTAMQRAARNGLLARCMADFVKDLAADRDAKVAAYQDLLFSFRESAIGAGLSGRATEQVAFLLLGAKLAAAHFHSAGVNVDTSGWLQILLALARKHAAHVLESQPAERFRAALAELLSSGAAYLEPVDEQGGAVHSLEIQRGRQIGWRNDAKGELYLLSAPVLELVNESLRKGDTALNIRPAALWRQCQQRGWLKFGNATVTGNESSRTVKIGGKVARALVFDQAAMLSE